MQAADFEGVAGLGWLAGLVGRATAKKIFFSQGLELLDGGIRRFSCTSHKKQWEGEWGEAAGVASESGSL